VGGVLTLSRALTDGGQVIWEPVDRPKLRVASAYTGALRRDAEEVREVLRRAVAFRRQVQRSLGGPLPLLVLPDAPEPRAGACISCGTPISGGWRCGPCLVAIYAALDAPPPLTEPRTGDSAA
jgi:hypothetical protein